MCKGVESVLSCAAKSAPCLINNHTVSAFASGFSLSDKTPVSTYPLISALSRSQSGKFWNSPNMMRDAEVFCGPNPARLHLRRYLSIAAQIQHNPGVLPCVMESSSSHFVHSHLNLSLSISAQFQESQKMMPDAMEWSGLCPVRLHPRRNRSIAAQFLPLFWAILDLPTRCDTVKIHQLVVN